MMLKSLSFYEMLKSSYELDKSMKEVFVQTESLNRQKEEQLGKILFDKDRIEEYEKRRAELKPSIETLKKKLSSSPLTANDKAVVMTLPETIEELEKGIAGELTRLQFIACDIQTLDQYEDKENELDKITSEKDELEAKMCEVEGKLIELRKGVVCGIKETVRPINTRFAELFRRLNCEGMVKFEEENLESSKWRLDIFVKFRNNGKLETLNSYRQSGGEKSVSTILFLLSLQEISPAPFRLVDEINQGMDKYNEKAVHSILVDLSVSQQSPQFFIITPKIVPDLVFSRDMKVIIVYSGCSSVLQETLKDYKHSLCN